MEYTKVSTRDIALGISILEIHAYNHLSKI